MRKGWPLLLIAFSLTINAANADDSIPAKSHYFSFDVISACLGTMRGSYEFMAGNHGIAVEGQYTFPWLGTKAYEGNVAYRYHFDTSAAGMFAGPYFKMGKTQGSITDDSRINYPYVLTYKTIGADWGIRKKLLKKKWLFYTFRLGAGYPFTSFTWKKDPPETIGGLSLHTFTTILKITAYLDSELTLTLAF